MANLIKYNIDTAFTSDSTFATALNGLTTSALTGVGSVISNGTNLAILADISFVLGSFTGAAPLYVELHIIPCTGDGSTYSDFMAGGPTLVATAAVTTGASVKALTFTEIPIPPGSFKFALFNNAGNTLAGSGNVVYYRLYNYTDAG